MLTWGKFDKQRLILLSKAIVFMKDDLLPIFEYMEREKGISREDMIAAIVNAIKKAALKDNQAAKEIRVAIDPKTGVLQAYTQYKVVDSVINDNVEMHISKALKKNSKAKLGDIIEEPLKLESLGRIAAQTVRQMINQSVRRFEKEHIYEQFQDRVGTIIQGVMRYSEHGNLIIDFGKAEGTLFHKQAIWSDKFQPGDPVDCLLQSIKETPHGPELVLSRTAPGFVIKLLEREIPELVSSDGRPARIQIKAIVRDPGYRTKICVTSSDSSIDPVGACIGSHGSRIKCVLKALGEQEKIDIIRYSDDLRTFISEITRPAVPQSLSIDDASRTIHFQLPEKDFAIFVGKSGRNLKLASQLLGYEIKVEHADSINLSFEDKKIQAMQTLIQFAGISDVAAAKLVDMGINSPEVLSSLTADDFKAAEFNMEDYDKIINKLQTQGKQSN